MAMYNDNKVAMKVLTKIKKPAKEGPNYNQKMVSIGTIQHPASTDYKK